MVRGMGLEPTRQRHTHLKRACLPIPASSHIAGVIIAPLHLIVNSFFAKEKKKPPKPTALAVYIINLKSPSTFCCGWDDAVCEEP